MKEVLFASEVRSRIKKGVDMAADAAKVTLGPRGRNVILSKTKYPQITNDGVTIIKELDSIDEYTKLGIQMIKQVAEKADKKGGDGTTTASVLAQEMISQGMKLVDSGYNPVLIKEGMFLALEDILEKIDYIKKDIGGYEEWKDIATISSGNEEMGELIASAFKVIGKDGSINVEPSRGFYDEVKTVDGFKVDKGYVSQYMVSDSTTKECVMENPLILITDQQIDGLERIGPLLEEISRQGKPLFIICSSVQERALGALVKNRLKGILNVCCIEAPGFGDRKSAILEDIAILTGGTFLSQSKGLDLGACNRDLDLLGTCGKIVVRKDETVFFGASGTEEDIKSRVEGLMLEMEDNDSQYEISKLEERIGMLSGGVAVIKIGSISETEMLEKKLRVEDAVNATRGAIKDGIVPGGGVTLLRIGADIHMRKGAHTLEDEIRTGYMIVMDSLEKPFRQILENSGMRPDEYRHKILENDNFEIGVDAKWKKIVDMYQEGIIDPAVVTKSSLENAVSVTALLLTTEAAIVPMAIELE